MFIGRHTPISPLSTLRNDAAGSVDFYRRRALYRHFTAVTRLDWMFMAGGLVHHPHCHYFSLSRFSPDSPLILYIFWHQQVFLFLKSLSLCLPCSVSLPPLLVSFFLFVTLPIMDKSGSLTDLLVVVGAPD